MAKKKIKDEKEGRFMKKISKKFFIAGILALCLAGGTVLASESEDVYKRQKQIFQMTCTGKKQRDKIKLLCTEKKNLL